MIEAKSRGKSDGAACCELTGRERLRRATDPIHQLMHRHPVMARLLKPEVSLQDVRSAAAVSYKAASHLETARAASGHWPCLSLEQHVSDACAEFSRGLRQHLDVPRSCSQSEYHLLGALYVMHGSAFGAKVIFNHVKRHIDAVPPGAFPDHDKTAWQALLTALGALSEAQSDEAVSGVQTQFLLYKRCADQIYGRGLE